jgi:hypothetical protein
MDEWQPARLKSFHSMNTPEAGAYLEKGDISLIESAVVKYRPVPRRYDIAYCRREADCPDGTRFFEVILPSGEIAIACEHELLAD